MVLWVLRILRKISPKKAIPPAATTGINRNFVLILRFFRNFRFGLHGIRLTFIYLPTTGKGLDRDQPRHISISQALSIPPAGCSPCAKTHHPRVAGRYGP